MKAEFKEEKKEVSHVGLYSPINESVVQGMSGSDREEMGGGRVIRRH